MTTTTIKQEVLAGLHFIPPRTWRSFWIQTASGLVLAALVLAFLAVVANDVPWTFLGAVIVLTLAVQAFLVTWRVRPSER